jgi:hypothetical protein
MKNLGLAAAAVAASLTVPLIAQGATVTGTVKGGKGMSISAIGLNGSATTAKIKGNGKFSLKVPGSRARNATLHLLTGTGDYFGPVVLARKGSTGYVRITTRTTALGTISRKSGFALASGLAKGSGYATAGSVKVNSKTGKPLGAGRLGLVKAANSSKEMARETQGGQQGGGGQGGGGQQGSNPNDPCGGAVGGDCDRDGVPNSLDVDDNGNLTIDFTDGVSVQTTAKLLTYSSVAPRITETLNYNTGATRDTINAFLGSTSATSPTGLNLTFYYQERSITGQDPSPALDAVWVTCGTSAPWCVQGTSQATISGFSEFPQILPSVPQFGSVNWSAFTGSTCGARGQACQPQPAGYPPFGFVKSQQQGGSVASNIWTAFIRPNSTDTLAQVNADSVINLNYRTSPGGPVNTKPIGISPYFVTTPAIQQVTANGSTQSLSYPYPANGAGTNDSNGFDLGTAGSIGLTLVPPQRFGLPGEAEQFYTVGGLSYGITLDSLTQLPAPGSSQGGSSQQRPNQEAGCAVTPTSGLAPRAPSNDPQDPWAVLTPVTDTTTTDAPATTPRTVAFTADIKGCIQKYLPGAPTSNVAVNLTVQAIGQPLQSGANRSSLSFSARLP